MPTELYEVRWSVPKTGYRWEQGPVLRHDGEPEGQSEKFPDGRPQWVLTDGWLIHQPHERIWYEPLVSHTGLFRVFAELPCDRDAIRSFANEYGPLGIGKKLCIAGEGNLAAMPTGETEDDWFREIDDMRRVVGLWDMVKRGDRDGLLRNFRWKAEGIDSGWYFDSHPNLPPNLFEIPPPEGRWAAYLGNEVVTNPADVFTPAMSLIRRELECHTKGTLSPLLVMHPRTGKSVLRLKLANLLSAMWLQFGLAVDGNKEHRACKTCGRWFEQSELKFDKDGSSRSRRSERLFCSDACKSKNYRHRRERALELHAQGKTAQVIAKEIDSEVAIIKRWVKDRKGK